ncbi:MAG TPA: hypothetical protein VMM15_13210 [Bradyrhizobium sp.]|nr:hypothetical protein [Bradyrhizobium sp.]
MRHYASKKVEQGYLDTLDAHPHSKEHAREQIERSRTQLVVSEEILSRPVPNAWHPEGRAMLTAAESRALADVFRSRAAEPGLPIRTATIMKNIAHSLAGLASQLELLTSATRSQS